MKKKRVDIRRILKLIAISIAWLVFGYFLLLVNFSIYEAFKLQFVVSTVDVFELLMIGYSGGLSSAILVSIVCAITLLELILLFVALRVRNKSIWLLVIAKRTAFLVAWLVLVFFLLIFNLNFFGLIITNYPAPFKGVISVLVVCLVSLTEAILIPVIFKWNSAFLSAFGIVKKKSHELSKGKRDYILFKKVFLSSFLTVVSVGVVVSICVNVYLYSTIDSMLNTAKSRGFALSMKDLDRKIPKGEDAAPEIEKVLKEAKDIDYKSVSGKKGFDRDKFIKKSLKMSWSEVDWETVDKILIKTDEPLRKLNSIATRYEKFQGTDYSKTSDDPFDYNHVSLPGAIYVCKIMCLSAGKALRSGNPESAELQLCAAIKTAKLIGQSDSFVFKMLCLKNQEDISGFVIACAREGHGAEFSGFLSAELGSMSNLELSRGGIRTEAALNFSVNSYMDESVWRYITTRKRLSLLSLPDFLYVCGNGAKFSQLKTLEYFLRVDTEINTDPLKADTGFMNKSNNGSGVPLWPYFLLYISMPRFDSTVKEEIAVDTLTQIAILSLALEKYKLENGAYPPKLELLSPKYVQKELLLDKFSKKDLVYKLTVKGALIYSVGSDLQDNDGDFKDEKDIGVLKIGTDTLN